MRQRATSMYVDRSQIQEEGEQSDLDDDDFSDDADIPDLETSAVVKSEWLGEDIREESSVSVKWNQETTLALIRSISAKYDLTDMKSYTHTLSQINWSELFQKDEIDDAKTHFTNMLHKVRKVRNFKEVCNDMEELVLKSYDQFCKPPPVNGYFLFVKENKEKIRKIKDKTKDPTPMIKLLSAHYKALSNTEKKIYTEKARARNNITGFSQKIPKPRTYRIKVLTPFNCYYLEQKNKDFRRKKDDIKQEWEHLPIQEKVQYIRMALKPNDEIEKKKILVAELQILDNFEGRPQKIPVAPYFLFRSEKILELDHLNTRAEKQAALKELWSSESTRKKYTKKFEKLKSAYLTDYEEYIKQLPEDRRMEILNNDLMKQTKKNQSESDESPRKKRKLSKIKKEKKENIKPNSLLNNEDDEQIISQKKKRKSPKKLKSDSSIVPISEKKEKKSKKSKNNANESYEMQQNNSISKIKDSPKKMQTKTNGVIVEEPERPPGSVFAYYLKYLHKGKPEKARNTWLNLTRPKQKSIKKQYNRKTAEYLKKLQLYLKSLPRKEMTEYVKNLDKNKQEEDDDDDELNVDSDDSSSTDEDETDIDG